MVKCPLVYRRASRKCGSKHYCLYTCRLSQPKADRPMDERRSLRRVLRYLVLGPVWRLDAFSASQLPA